MSLKHADETVKDPLLREKPPFLIEDESSERFKIPGFPHIVQNVKENLLAFPPFSLPGKVTGIRNAAGQIIAPVCPVIIRLRFGMIADIFIQLCSLDEADHMGGP